MAIRLRLRRHRLLLGILLIAALLLALSLSVKSKRRETSGEEKARPTLVIDPGHGGVDSGALGADGTKESDLNLAIGLKLRALAEFCGQDNVMIRQDDSTKCDTEVYSEHRDLECRTAIVNEAVNPVYISIHQNDYPTGQPSGAQVIYAAGEGSETLAQVTHANLLENLYPNSRRVAEPASKKLYILSHVECPAILVECGFISNVIDLENLKKPGYQTSLAAILMASFLQFEKNTIRI